MFAFWQPRNSYYHGARRQSSATLTQRANISGRNEMAAQLGSALIMASEELAESYAVLKQRVQEKQFAWKHKTSLSALWQANRRPGIFTGSGYVSVFSPVPNGLQNLTQLHDIERKPMTEDEDITVNLPVSRTSLR